MGVFGNLKQNIGKLFKTGLFHIFGINVINKIVAFLSSTLLVWILTKEEYGVFSYAWNIYHFLLLINGLGLTVGALQLCSENPDEEYCNLIFNNCLKIGLLIDLVLTAAIVVFSLCFNFSIPPARILLIILCALPLLQYLFDLLTVYLRVKKRNMAYAWTMMLNTVLTAVFTALGAFLLRDKGLICGYYLSYIITLFVGFFVFRFKFKDVKNTPKLEKSLLKTLFKISIISMCTNALSQLLFLLDTFIIGVICVDELLVANYKVATMIPTALLFIPSSMVIYIYPYFARHAGDGKWCLKKFFQVLVGMAAINGIISIILYFAAPFVIKIVYGEQYLEIVPIFRILVINFFVSGTFRAISGNIICTQRKFVFSLVESVISGAVNIAADILFIKYFGIIGAAYATCLVVALSSLISTVYLLILFNKKPPVQPAAQEDEI